MKINRSPYFLPMSIAGHEAAHAVAALTMGIPVVEVRIDRPEIGTVGWCLTPSEHSYTTANLVTILAPGIAGHAAGSTDRDVWPPTWPIQDGRGDQGAVHRIVNALGMTEETYEAIVRLTHSLVRDPSFQTAYRRLAVALKESSEGVLAASEIRRIVLPLLPQDEGEPDGLQAAFG